jgi:serine kinase of HPr protein (carbohydrate metabolism regulator)
VTTPTAIQVHATCVVLAETGVLLCGPSGCGKSDLALRLVEAGARLVSDDRVELERRDGALWALAPAALAGLLEVRGLGIVRLDADKCQPEGVRLALAVDLVDAAAVERLPEAAKRGWLGVDVPLLALHPWPASATAKLRLAAGLARQGALFAH